MKYLIIFFMYAKIYIKWERVSILKPVGLGTLPVLQILYADFSMPTRAVKERIKS